LFFLCVTEKNEYLEEEEEAIMSKEELQIISNNTMWRTQECKLKSVPTVRILWQ
jgi:hypothetical protein